MYNLASGSHTRAALANGHKLMSLFDMKVKYIIMNQYKYINRKRRKYKKIYFLHFKWVFK